MRHPFFISFFLLEKNEKKSLLPRAQTDVMRVLKMEEDGEALLRKFRAHSKGHHPDSSR